MGLWVPSRVYRIVLARGEEDQQRRSEVVRSGASSRKEAMVLEDGEPAVVLGVQPGVFYVGDGQRGT